MKKLFVSVPMRGRTDEAIRNSIKQMHEIAEIVFGEELEVIPNYVQSGLDLPENINYPLYQLGKSLQNMAKADYFIGIGWSDYFKECNIEKDAASYYGLRCFNLYIYDCDFLKDAAILERECWNKHTNVRESTIMSEAKC